MSRGTQSVHENFGLGQETKNRGRGSSPCCASSCSHAIVFASSRGVVPVLKRPKRRPRACNGAEETRWCVTYPAPFELLFADVTRGHSESTGRNDDRTGFNCLARLQPKSSDVRRLIFEGHHFAFNRRDSGIIQITLLI